MREMLDVLEEAKRMLLDEEEQQEAQEGQEGEEGMMGEGEMLLPGEGEEGMPGDMPGSIPGNMPGDRSRDGEPGDIPDGSFGPGAEEGGQDGVSNMTEPIYDPISGAVPYGDVFSSYYSDYLGDAENGDIPFELQEAAEAYFRSLDQ